MMGRLFVAFGFIVIGVFSTSAQSPAQYIAKGDKELHDGFPESALFYYSIALEKDETIVEAHFKSGEAFRAQRNYKRAEIAYQKTAQLDEQDLFPEALFWQGMMLKQQGDYQKAKQSLQAFAAVYRLRDDFYRMVREEEASCDWAIEHMNDTAYFQVLAVDSGLNTVHSEMSPRLLDSNTMYFSTVRHESDASKKNKAVFVEQKKAIKEANSWTLVELDLPIQDDNAHVGNGSFTSDSNRYYYSNCPERDQCAIYEIKKENGQWGVPKKMPSPINETGSSSTQPMAATSGDDEYLFFASDRSNGKGGLDIWYVELKKGEPTTRLRNMGTRINSKGDEITPWFDSSDTTLYFSSNRQLGFGGFDIYKSKGLPGKLNLVENAGTDLNSPADDYYFAFLAKDSLGYFASNRVSGTKLADNETCCNDLYKVRPKKIESMEPTPIDTLKPDTLLITQVEQPAKDSFVVPTNIEEVQDLLPISLYFHNDRPNPRTMATTTKLTYSETIKEYLGLEAEYLSKISGSKLSTSEKEAMLHQTKQFFENDLTGSVSRINAALNVLLIELEKGEDVEIVVKGYASPLANSDYNLNLTYRRIDAMENYIRTYKNGAFEPYFSTENDGVGHLTIQKIPYGESQASDAISDNQSDQISAIYSPNAAKERRIEILRVTKK
jgi:tetratricopeptide (TPR) repeat protein